MEQNYGYIYIFTNESFHKSSWVKIGYTENIQRRLRELSNTSLPKPFDVYATYQIPKNDLMPDVALHDIIQKLNPTLRLSPNREFFEIEPWDAYDILFAMAKIHGRTDKLYQNKNNIYFNDPEKLNPVGRYSVDKLFPQDSYIRTLFENIKKITLEIAPQLKQVAVKNYVAFKNNKRNIISIWPKSNSIEIVLHAKLGTISTDNDIIYDISNRLWSGAQYALRYDENVDIEIVKNLIKQTYFISEK